MGFMFVFLFNAKTYGMRVEQRIAQLEKHCHDLREDIHWKRIALESLQDSEAQCFFLYQTESEEEEARRAADRRRIEKIEAKEIEIAQLKRKVADLEQRLERLREGCDCLDCVIL